MGSIKETELQVREGMGSLTAYHTCVSVLLEALLPHLTKPGSYHTVVLPPFLCVDHVNRWKVCWL